MSMIRSIAGMLAALPLIAAAQNADPAQALVAAAEAGFWNAYNACDYAELNKRIANDVEFYTDVGGTTLGRTALVGRIRTNICGDAQVKTRRDTKPEEIRTDLLTQNGQVIGALVSGTHYFYIKRGAAAEVPEGRTRYTNLWLLNKGKWELKRAFSVDHQPFGAPTKIAAAAEPMSAARIDNYVGTFTGPRVPPFVFARENGALTVAFEGKKLVLHPLAKANVFLVKENNVEVEFDGGDAGPARSLVVRMNGNTMGEATRQ
jgi:hypothetical protein